jgi:hypothetical protein
VLGSAVWTAPPDAVGAAMAMPREDRDAQCARTVASAGTGDGAGDGGVDTVRGLLFVAEGTRRPQDQRPLRALFVPAEPERNHSVQLIAASVDPDSGACLLIGTVLSQPRALNSRVVFDAGLRYFYYTVEGEHTPVPSVVVQQMDWERGDDGRLHAVTRTTLTVLTAPPALAAVSQALEGTTAGHAASIVSTASTADAVAGGKSSAAGAARPADKGAAPMARGRTVAVLPTWHVPGGRVVQMGARRWQLFANVAQTVELDKTDADLLQTLQPAAAESPCRHLSALFSDAADGPRRQILEHREHCFLVARGWPAAQPDVLSDRQQVRVAVYERPDTNDLELLRSNPPAPVASLLPYARVPAAQGEVEPLQWAVGVGGRYDGWLLLRSAAGQRTSHLGMPWSTCALWRVARHLQTANPPPQDSEREPARVCDS